MQKKMRFLIIAAMLVSITSIAQLKKGDRMAGASVGSAFFNSGSSDVSFPSIRGYTSKTNSYGLQIQPTMGWFISDKTAVGVSLNINPAGQKVLYQDNGITFQKDQSNSFNFGIGGFARNYFSSGGSFMPFGQFGFNLGISSMTTKGFKYYTATPNYENIYNGKSSGGFFANAALLLGMTKMVAEHTGLDLYVGYNFSYNKNTFKTTTSTDTNDDGTIDFSSVSEPTTKFTNNGFIVAVGFQVFLPGKKK